MGSESEFVAQGGVQYAPWQRTGDQERDGRLQAATMRVDDHAITIEAKGRSGRVRFTRADLDGIFYLSGVPLLTGVALRLRAGDESVTFWGRRVRRLRRELVRRGWEVRVRHL